MLLTIDKLIYGGDGLARTPPDERGRGMAVFVPFVLSGERVEATITSDKPVFSRGTVKQLVEPAPERVLAPCPYFQRCGGCHYQHIEYEKQLEYKAAILRETLQRIAKIELDQEIKLHPSPTYGYRNRTRLRVQAKSQFALGYYKFGSHEFLSVRECPISSPCINSIIARLTQIGGANCPPEIEELELFADHADEHLLAWAFCSRDAEESALLQWANAVRREIPSITGLGFFASRHRSEDEPAPELKTTTYSGANKLRYRVADVEYHVASGAFFQVNRHLLDDLVSTVIGNTGGDLALDLYAGVGLFSLPLSRSFHHIFAVEASQISHTGLRQNVPANVKAVGARTEDYLRNPPLRKLPDLVVVDPPRAGLGKSVVRSLVELGAPRVRYISCDPATLARDLGPLLASGYRIEEAHLFDLFPQTFHIETVMLLSR